MAAKNSSPELSFGDWEGEDVDELLKQHKLDLIAVVWLLGVAFVHSDQRARAKAFFFLTIYIYIMGGLAKGGMLPSLQDIKKIMGWGGGGGGGGGGE